MMNMGFVDIGGVLIAVIAALGAWAAQKSAAKASKANTTVSGRLEAERGAYERARAFDVATIERQDEELKELRESNKTLKEELAAVKARLAELEQRVRDEPDTYLE
jgi:predicted RNase H-like nuclease (RuvC/YqgF family)